MNSCTCKLYVCEGPEEALTVKYNFERSFVVSTIYATNYDKITIPEYVNKVILVPDLDEAGLSAASRAYKNYKKQGKKVSLLVSLTKVIDKFTGKYLDWNAMSRINPEVAKRLFNEAELVGNLIESAIDEYPIYSRDEIISKCGDKYGVPGKFTEKYLDIAMMEESRAKRAPEPEESKIEFPKEEAIKVVREE